MALKEKTLRGTHRVNEDFYILKDAGAVVELVGPPKDSVYGTTLPQKETGRIKWAYWGADNLRPQRILKLVAQNHLKPQLLQTSRDFLLGSRIGVFERSIVKDPAGGPNKVRLEPAWAPDVEQWLEDMEHAKYMRQAGFNLEYFSNVFTGISLDGKKKVNEIKCYDSTDTRVGLKNPKTGLIERYFLNTDWYTAKDDNMRIVAAYDKRNPTKYGDFIYHGRDWVPGNPYYDYPAWHGSENWTEVSNLIPIFHKSGLKNGYNLKYHIKIPRDYFKNFGDKAAEQKAEQDLIDSMNKFLAGVENADKAFVSKYGYDPQTAKPMPGWEIEPLKNPMSDNAYSTVNTDANVAQSSSHGIDLSLAGIDTGSKMGGSGSEKRISTQIHIAYKTPNKRAILMEPLNVAMRIMGFDKKLVLGIEDVDIVTLAENPKGQEKTANNQQ